MGNKDIILIDKTFETSYSLEYKSIFDDKITALSKALNLDIKSINLVNKTSFEDYIEALYQEAKEYSNVILIYSNMPMIDIKETKSLYELHINNFAFYTYGENYPKGIVPSVLRVGAFERAMSIIKGKNIVCSTSAIHEAIFTDPNFFEIEILVSKYDLRYYRLDFTAVNKSNNMLISRLKDFTSYQKIAAAIIEKKVSTRSLPAYFQIDVSSTSNNTKRYLSEIGANSESFLSVENFDRIYDDALDYTEKCHLSIGVHGEPLLNEHIFEILNKALSNKNAIVYLETNAILLTNDNAKRIADLQHENSNFNVIIHLDAIEPDVYNTIYTNDHLNVVLENLDYYLLRASENTYIQIIKQKDNFDSLKNFYAYFEKYKVKIIMQKCPTYRGLVKSGKVGDLAPIERMPCWHIKRDMYIDQNGDSYICSYDIQKSIRIGNVLESSVEQVWNAYDEYYQKDICGSIDFCSNCDEWYLYNF